MERWQEAEQLFEAAVELPLDRRAVFLGEACAGDTELLREVEDLLAADYKNGEGILAAIEGEALSLFGQEGMVGSRIGAYRIEGEIGRGGMSTVYRAVRDDDQFQKQVAIKLIRRGMDTEDMLDRFRHERQILANLEHPYIARLLDGGAAPDGRPFLVMEYLQGEPLDGFCQNQGLDLRARLRLFLKVCEAVSFAHRNLVVHRDLKPGNILVATNGSPKLLDFGVAKLLDADTAGRTATLVALRPMTPDYASPEQFRGDAITTAADVYSLGAILYQLLTGQRPHRFSSYGLRELERVICEVEPLRASEAATRWNGELRGDLDAIVAKTMRKEPKQRYASVDQLALDLERYLDGWPVHARQGDVSYRSRKFLRRNRASLAVTGLLAATLIAGATAALLQARRAGRESARALVSQSAAEASQREARQEALEAQRQRGLADEQRRQADAEKALAEAQKQLADRRFEQVHQLAGKFLFDFNDSISKLPGSTSARKMVVETGLQYFDTLVKGAQGNRDLLEEIARGYDRLGNVQGNPYEANLGDMPGALKTYQKAREIRERIHDSSPEFLRARIDGNLKIAELMLTANNTKGAEPALQAAFALVRSPQAAGFDLRAKLADTYMHYGDLKVRSGVYTEATAPYSQALDLLLQLTLEGGNHTQDAITYKTSVAQLKLGDSYARTERATDALPHVRAALAIDLPRLDADPNNLTKMRKVCLDYIILGYVYLSDSGSDLDPGHQATAFEKAAEIAERMAAADPKDVRPLVDLRTTQTSWGDFLRDHDHNFEAALLHYRRALDITEKQNTTPAFNYETLVSAHQRLSRGLVSAGKFDEAMEHLQLADESLAKLEQQNPGLLPWVQWKYNIAKIRAEAYVGMKKWPDAVAEYGREIAGLEISRQREPNNISNIEWLRVAQIALSDCYAAQGKWSEAAQARQAALSRIQELAARRPLREEEVKSRTEALAKLAVWKK